MAQARRERARSSGPAAWMVLLGLMVLALVIAALADDGDPENASPAAQSPAPTTSTAAAAAGTAQEVIDQINQTLTTDGLPFVVGKAELAAASGATLDKVAAILAKNPKVKAEVRGFTDDQGDAAKNEQLSLLRAQEVVTYLTGKGIAAGRLEAKGLGEASPKFDNTTETGRAKNRRVEFALA